MARARYPNRAPTRLIVVGHLPDFHAGHPVMFLLFIPSREVPVPVVTMSGCHGSTRMANFPVGVSRLTGLGSVDW